MQSETGMRMGELFGLQWGDLDFNSRFVEVRSSIVSGRIETPKNGHLRCLDMSSQLAQGLKKFEASAKRRRSQSRKRTTRLGVC